MNDKRKIISRYTTVTVEEDLPTGRRSLHAVKAFRKDEIISLFAAVEEHSSPTYLTLQKDEDQHIVLSPSFLQYVNHSCLPSAFFDTTLMQFVALKNIAEGEELTFFYPSARMAQAFDCLCGCQNCLGKIEGAAFLSAEILERYRLTDFILRKLQEQKEKRA